MIGGVLLVLAIVVGLIYVLFAAAGGSAAPADQEGPAELADATLLAVEQTLKANEPYFVIGRPDRVYQRPDGVCIPFELKTRPQARAYQSDIAQLSLQALLLRQNGYKTGPRGYVRVETPEVSYLPVTLWSDARCMDLIQRYHAIRAGQVAPTRASGAKCTKCGFRGRCA